MVVGHADVVRSLVRDFPPVALLWGPKSVGKWTAAEHARAENKIFEPDVLRIRRLGMDEARSVVDFASRAAHTESGRAVLIDLDTGSASAQATLLKTLEDTGPSVHFLLTSSRSCPDTLRSRARQYTFGLLSSGEVAQVMRARGHSVAQSVRLGEQSGGQVRAALAALGMAENKSVVLAAVRALREGDSEALVALADRWRDEHTTLLVQWGHEAVSGRWRLFNDAESGLSNTLLPLRVLIALRRDVRPRLVVRSVLADVLKEMT